MDTPSQDTDAFSQHPGQNQHFAATFRPCTHCCGVSTAPEHSMVRSTPMPLVNSWSGF